MPTSMNEKNQYRNRIELLWARSMCKGKRQLVSDLSKWERIVDATGSIMRVRPEENET